MYNLLQQAKPILFVSSHCHSYKQKGRWVGSTDTYISFGAEFKLLNGQICSIIPLKDTLVSLNTMHFVCN